MRSLHTAVALTLLCATPAFAVWPVQGQYVMAPDDMANGTDRVWIMPHPSGDLLVRATGVGGNSYGYSVQRISSAGDIAAGWPAAGMSFGTVSKSFSPHQVGFTLDGGGNLWQMTSNGGRMATLRGIEPGALTPATPINLTSATSTVSLNAFAPGPSGGMYAYWNNKLQRYSAAGTLASGWPANAVNTLNSFGTEVAALADGAGGVVIMAIDLGNTGMPAVQRVDSTGVRHAGWAALGVPLTNDPLEMYTSFSPSVASLPALIPSGTHAFLAAWTSLPDANQSRHIVIQRMSVDGVRDPAWPSVGRLVMTQGPLVGADVLPDGSGGAYIVWFDGSTALASHVLADGTFANAAAEQGTLLVQPGDAYRPPRRWISNRFQHVPAAVSSDGGLAIAWDDTLVAHAVRVRWYTPSLAVDSREPAEGRLIHMESDPTDDCTIRELHGDGQRGMYVAWDRSSFTTPFAFPSGIWMTHLDATPVGAGVTPSGNPLALSAPRPNPTRGSAAFELTLPDDSAAQLELLDLAGRVVQSRSVAGAGRHAVTFDALDRVSPGLYFVRARARSGVSTSRVVVSH